MTKKSAAKIAWAVLIYNVIVVVWGVFLRASKSGDGCGKYWLTCHGEVIPSAPQFKTVIEFSHRLMSGIDFLLVLGFMVIVIVYFKERRQARIFAVLSFLFIVTEALIGAGLVLTGNVAETHTAARPLWAVGHLINTFLLLGSLTVTARILSTGRDLRIFQDSKLQLVAFAGTAAIIFVGITGAIAALSNTLFPSASLTEAIAKDFLPSSDMLLRIRILHPIGSLISGFFLIWAAFWFKKNVTDSVQIGRFGSVLAVLVAVQLLFGALTLLTGAPIVMQLMHLLLADAVWIVWIVIVTEAFWKLEAPDH